MLLRESQFFVLTRIELESWVLKNPLYADFVFSCSSSLATFKTYYQPVIKSLQAPTATIKCIYDTTFTLSTYCNAVGKARALSKAQWAGASIVALEVLGFFSVGEMIGRRKIVGYRGDVAHEEH